jgi:hypothetical protein
MLTKGKLPWMEKVELESAYASVGEYGYDFNVLKHKNHGIEWRVLDSFDLNYLEQLGNLMVLIAEYSDQLFSEKGFDHLPNPRKSKIWNDMTFECVYKSGSEAPIDHEWFNTLGIPYDKSLNYTAYETLKLISKHLFENYKDSYLVTHFIKGTFNEPFISNLNAKVTEKFMMQ